MHGSTRSVLISALLEVQKADVTVAPLTLFHMAFFVLFIAWPGALMDPHTKTTLLEIKDDFDDVRGANRPPAMQR